MAVSRDLRRRVIERAANRCEYCQMPAEFDVAHFEIDHIRAQVHSGETVFENLAWACFPCNNGKGPNLAGVDNATDNVELLYHPRRDNCTSTSSGTAHVWQAKHRSEGRRLQFSISTRQAASRFAGNSSRKEASRRRCKAYV